MPIFFALKQITLPVSRRAAATPAPQLVARVVVGLAALGFAGATAKETRTSFAVSGSVAAIARIVQQTTPADLQISSADLQHGFLDVQSLDLVVQSNSSQGFALDVVTVAPILTAIEVEGLGSRARLGGDGGVVVQRWQGPQTVHLALHLRFGLLAGLTPGRYPWPVRVFVRPLDR
jgi:hypothetical protein